MLKVLIADDEQKVCQLIANIIDWNAYGFEIVGVVNDGLTAYRFLQDKPVDLMITDIRMPGCDGMELIQKALVLYPEMHFVIISGYSQFDYAQQAIRYGVEDYLLKPIRKKDLVAALQKILDKYTEETRDSVKLQNYENLLKKNEEILKKSLLEDILKRPEKFGGFFMRDRINEEYCYHFIDGYYRTMTMMLIPEARKEDTDTRRLLLKKGLETLEMVTANMCNEVVLSIVNEKIYGIFNGNEEEMKQIPRKIKKAKMDLMQLQDIFEGLKVFVSLGDEVNNFQNIQEEFLKTTQALNGRFYYGKDLILEIIRDEKKDEIVNEIIDNSFKKRFLNYIEIMDMDSIKVEMEKLETILNEDAAKNGNVVKEIYKEVLSIFYFGTHSFNIIVPEQYTELIEKLEIYTTIQEVCGQLSNYMITSLKHWMDEKMYVESKPIRVAKQYIGQNYFKSLTLEMVSKEIGFNATYFSSMFKKETGMNFSEYLKEVRIENAKTILLESNQSVEDISYAIGYADIKYFSRLFKKSTGVTPTEFRKLYN